MEILQLVDQLEDVLNRGLRIPLTSSLVVNEEECLRLIDQMRISVPSAIKEGERMLSEQDRILSEAQAEAERLVTEAQRRAHEMLQDQTIISMAQAEAERIAQEGSVEATQLVQEAEDYAVRVLQQMAKSLANALQQVENGLQTMNGAGPHPGDGE